MASSSKKSPKRSGKKKKPVTISRKTAPDEDSSPGNVRDHKHCFNCGISIPPDRDICSDKCQAEWDRLLKRKKMLTYLPFIGMGLLLLFYILVVANG
jgi:predicted nucleic acid-binding Zn ribbon protein